MTPEERLLARMAAKAASSSAPSPAPAPTEPAQQTAEERLRARMASKPAPVAAAPKPVALPKPTPAAAPKPAPVVAAPKPTPAPAPAPAPAPVVEIPRIAPEKWQTMTLAEREAAGKARAAMKEAAAPKPSTEPVVFPVSKTEGYQMPAGTSFSEGVKGLEAMRADEEAKAAEAAKPELKSYTENLEYRAPTLQPEYRPGYGGALSEKEKAAEKIPGATLKDLQAAQERVDRARNPNPMLRGLPLAAAAQAYEQRAAEEDLRHIRAVRETGYDPLQSTTLKDIASAGQERMYGGGIPYDVQETIRVQDIAAQRGGAAPMTEAEKQALYERMVPAEQRARYAARLEQFQAGKASESAAREAVAKEEASRLGVVERTVAATFPENVALQRAAKSHIRDMAERNQHIDETKANEAFIKEAAEWLMANKRWDQLPLWTPGPDGLPVRDASGQQVNPRAEKEIEARKEAVKWLASLRAESTNLWPYPVSDSDYIPRDKLSYADYVKAFVLPTQEVTPSGGSVRTTNPVVHAISMLSLPATVAAEYGRAALGGDMDMYYALHHKTSGYDRIVLDAQNVPKYKAMIEGANVQSAEGLENLAGVTAVTGLAIVGDILLDLPTIGGAAMKGFSELGTAARASRAMQAAVKEGRAADEVLKIGALVAQKDAGVVAERLRTAAKAEKNSKVANDMLNAAQEMERRARTTVLNLSPEEQVVLERNRQHGLLGQDPQSRAVNEVLQESGGPRGAVLPDVAEAALPQVASDLSAAKTKVTDLETQIEGVRSRFAAEEDALRAEGQAARITTEERAARTDELRGRRELELKPLQDARKEAARTRETLQMAHDAIKSGEYRTAYQSAGAEARRTLAEQMAKSEPVQAVPQTDVFPRPPAPQVVPRPDVEAIRQVFGEDIGTGEKMRRVVTAQSFREALQAAKDEGRNTPAVEKLAADIVAHMESTPEMGQVVADMRARFASRTTPVTNTELLYALASADSRNVLLKGYTDRLNAAQLRVDAARTSLQRLRDMEDMAAAPAGKKLFAKEKEELRAAQAELDNIQKEMAAPEAPPTTEPAVEPVAEPAVPQTPEQTREAIVTELRSPDVAPVDDISSAEGLTEAFQREQRFNLDSLWFAASGEPFSLPLATYMPSPTLGAKQHAHLLYNAGAREYGSDRTRALGKYLVGEGTEDFVRNFNLPKIESISDAKAFKLMVTVDAEPGTAAAQFAKGGAPQLYTQTLAKKLNDLKDARPKVTPVEFTPVARNLPETGTRPRANTVNNYLRSLLPFSDKLAKPEDVSLIRLGDLVLVNDAEAARGLGKYHPPQSAESLDQVDKFVGRVEGFKDGKAIVRPYDFTPNQRNLAPKSKFAPVEVSSENLDYMERGRVWRRPQLARMQDTQRPMLDAEWKAIRDAEDKMPGARTLRYRPQVADTMVMLDPPAPTTLDSYWFSPANIADPELRAQAEAASRNYRYSGLATPLPEEVGLPPESVAARAVEAAPAPTAPAAPAATPKFTQADLDNAQARVATARNELEKAQKARSSAKTAARGGLSQRIADAQTALDKAQADMDAARALHNAASDADAKISEALGVAQRQRADITQEVLTHERSVEDAESWLRRRNPRPVEGVTPARARFEQQARDVAARLGEDPRRVDARLQAHETLANRLHADYPNEFPTTDAYYAKLTQEVGTRAQQEAEAAQFSAGTAGPEKLAHMSEDQQQVEDTLQKLREQNTELGAQRAAIVEKRAKSMLQRIERMRGTAEETAERAARTGDLAAEDAAYLAQRRLEEARSHLRTMLENESRKVKAAPPRVSSRTGTEALDARMRAAVQFEGASAEDVDDARRLMQMLEHPLEGGGFRVRTRLNKTNTALGAYNFSQDVVSLAQRAMREGTTVRTLAHELGHRISTWLSEALSKDLLRQYIKERRAALLAHPTWFDESGRLLKTAPAEAYRWTDVDEWFAERFADYSKMRLGQWDASKRSVMDAAKFMLQKVKARISKFFGVDAVPAIVEDLMAGRIEQVVADARAPVRDRLVQIRDVSGHGGTRITRPEWQGGSTITPHKKMPHMEQQTLRGMTTAQDGANTLLTFFHTANAETLVHEPAHFLQTVLPPSVLAEVEAALGVVDGQWTRTQSEAFANQFTTFLMNDRKTGNAALDAAYADIRESLKALYADGSVPVDLDPRLDTVFQKLTQDTAKSKVKTLGGYGGRETLARQVQVMREYSKRIGPQARLESLRRFGKNVAALLFQSSRERSLQSLTPAVRRIVETTDGELSNLNRTIGKVLAKGGNPIAEVLDDAADTTITTFAFDAIKNDSLKSERKIVTTSYLDTARSKPLTKEEEAELYNALRVDASGVPHTSAQSMADRLYEVSVAIAQQQGVDLSLAVRPREIGDAMFTQSLGLVGIEQNAIVQGIGVGAAVSNEAASKAALYAADGMDSDEGMQIVLNAIDNPLNYEPPLKSLLDLRPGATYEQRVPFGSVGQFASDYTKVLSDSEVYVPLAVRDMMMERLNEVHSTQKLSEGGKIFLSRWKRALTAGYITVRPWYHWVNMFSDVEQVASHIGLDAAMRMAAQSTLHNAVMGSGLARTAGLTGDVLRRLFTGEWAYGKTLEEMDKVLAYGAFGKPTTGVLDMTGEFVTKDGRRFSNVALNKILSQKGAMETQGMQDLADQLRSLAQQSGATNVGERATNAVGRAFAANARQVTDIANLIAQRRRVGLALTLIDMGYEPERAAEMVVGALYDYKHSLHPIERDWWQFANPFWAYKKNNTRRALLDVLRPGALRRVRVMYEGKKKVGQTLTAYLTDTLSPTGFDIEAMQQDDRDRPEGEKQYPMYLRAMAALHAPSAQFPKGLTDEQIFKMIREQGWGSHLMGLENLQTQYWSDNPMQGMLPSYVWDKIAVFASVPRTTENFRLYTVGEGRRDKPFDQYRALVLPGDANLEGLDVGVSLGIAVVDAYAAMKQSDPGAAGRLTALMPKLIGDPTRNPYFVAIVNGALGSGDPEDLAKLNGKLPDGVGEALNRFGGERLATVNRDFERGEGGGESSVQGSRYAMPAITRAMLDVLNVSPFLDAATTTENVYRMGTGGAAAGTADDEWKWNVFTMVTGQKTNVYSLYAQQRQQDFQARKRIEDATAVVKPTAAMLPVDAALHAGQPTYPPGTPEPLPPMEQPAQRTPNPWDPFFAVRGPDIPMLSGDALDAYYNEPGAYERMSNRAARQPGLPDDNAASFVWWYWASRRAQAGIPPEKSGLGAFQRFAPVYQKMLQRGVTPQEDEKFVLQLDYPAEAQ